MSSKYYDIAIAVAKRTPVTIEDVSATIRDTISALYGFGYSKEKIEKSITVEHIENIVMKRVARGRY